MSLKPFRANDVIEPKIRDCALPILDQLGQDRDDFWEDAFKCAVLGDVIYNLGRDPMTNGVLTPEVYRQSFWAIHQIFTRPGTFEFYLAVFRAIWGDDVEVVFTVPQPGVLNINISEIDIGLFNFTARRIVDNQYILEDVITQDGDEIIFQSPIGTKNQSEVDSLIWEISPAGIVVNATLVL